MSRPNPGIQPVADRHGINEDWSEEIGVGVESFLVEGDGRSNDAHRVGGGRQAQFSWASCRVAARGGGFGTVRSFENAECTWASIAR